MKYIIQFSLFLFLSIELILSVHITPKGNDLSSHWGTRPRDNKYGPSAPEGVDLSRKGRGRNITSITNYDKELNTSEIVSGSLDNTAYDASKIEKPEYAHKKAEIFTHVHQQHKVEVPEVVGMYYDKPIIGLKEKKINVDNVVRDVLDLETGESLE